MTRIESARIEKYHKIVQMNKINFPFKEMNYCVEIKKIIIELISFIFTSIISFLEEIREIKEIIDSRDKNCLNTGSYISNSNTVQTIDDDIK